MKASHFSRDTQEFLLLLTRHRVNYVIVGGEAVIYHGHARLTGDVDFYYEGSRENALKLYAALREFWSGDIPGVSSWEEFTEVGVIIQFGVPPNRLDLLNSIDGVAFEEAWENRVEVTAEISGKTVPVYFLGLNELIKNKEAMKRPKDLEDLKYLWKARERLR
ncbi:MAG TPA: DUF6036 family nucleotidyltransferase [Syntrophobacteria bacterium]|nr:DUF6036 family nucleotidyltransferase [Syntrophobacteria bacterium]